MKKLYFFLTLFLTAVIGFSASAAKTVTIVCDKAENLLLRDGGADGDIIPVSEDGQKVTIESETLYVAASTEDFILSQVYYTSQYGYNAWATVSDGACMIRVADMSEENTSVYVKLESPLSLYMNVANPDIISLTEGMSGNAITLSEGMNEFKVAPGTSLTLAVTNASEYKLTEVWTSSNPDNKLKVSGFSSCYIGSYDYKDGDMIEYVVVPASEFETPSFKLNIDDPSKVKVSVDYQVLEGLSTQNIIEMSGETSSVSISAMEYGTSIYKVSLNGEALTTSYSYYITVSPEDVIDVEYNYPDIDFTFNAYTLPADDSDLVTVKIGGESYELGTSVSVKAGTKVEVSFDNDHGSVVSVLKNGETVSAYDVSSFFLADNTSLEIVMNRYEELPIVVDINEPEAVKVQISYQPVELKPGRNELTFVKKDYGNSLTVKANPGYVINSVSSELNGEKKEYELFYGNYNVDLEENMVIYIDAVALAKDTKAVIYSSFPKEDAIFYNGKCNFQSTYDNEPFDFGVGYTEIEFNNLQSTFSLSGFMADFSNPEFFVYLNHEPQEAFYGSYNLKLDNNSVLKLFLNEEPAAYKAAFNIEDDVKVEVIANLVESVDTGVDFEDLQGTLIQVRGLEDQAISVAATSAAGEAITVDSDGGVYSVVMDSDLTIHIAKATSGVDSIGAGCNGAAVYTATGVYMGDSIENLPAGIYIVGGRKVIVR